MTTSTPAPLVSFSNVLGADARIVRLGDRLFIELHQEHFGGETWVVLGTEAGYPATPAGLADATETLLRNALDYVVGDLAEVLTDADLV